MRIWIDAQLSPALADWISQRYKHIEAKAVRAVDLRDAEDREIFGEARNAASDTTEERRTLAPSAALVAVGERRTGVVKSAPQHSNTKTP
jgi:hypothetical protein